MQEEETGNFALGQRRCEGQGHMDSCLGFLRKGGGEWASRWPSVIPLQVGILRDPASPPRSFTLARFSTRPRAAPSRAGGA